MCLRHCVCDKRSNGRVRNCGHSWVKDHCLSSTSPQTEQHNIECDVICGMSSYRRIGTKRYSLGEHWRKIHNSHIFLILESRKVQLIPAPLFCLTKGNRGAARATGLSMDLRFFCSTKNEEENKSQNKITRGMWGQVITKQNRRYRIESMEDRKTQRWRAKRGDIR